METESWRAGIDSSMASVLDYRIQTDDFCLRHAVHFTYCGPHREERHERAFVETELRRPLTPFEEDQLRAARVREWTMTGAERDEAVELLARFIGSQWGITVTDFVPIRLPKQAVRASLASWERMVEARADRAHAETALGAYRLRHRLREAWRRLEAQLRVDRWRIEYDVEVPVDTLLTLQGMELQP